MEDEKKVRDTMEGREHSFTLGETVSTNGNHGTTEVQQQAPRQKIGDSETKDLTKDERIELAGHDIDDACGQFEEKMKTRDYRPFVDESGFVYRFTLVRKDILKNRLAKHRMKAELMDIRRERLLSENLRGKDGADDGQRLYLPMSTAPQSVNEGDAAVDSVEPRRRKPSVTVLMHSHRTIPDTNLEIQARTPESGW
ncbi:hypothetical protein AYO20_04215 [Fonsecaea nubica]|uniref:Uncharacterized protein n=1 Tax=Fonsecaea nubica TaxID=856822 RepID=A0A178D3F0_9EURO|nr:hypothetical protein AYO20_04215 [Fonsecaea nubica]OAL36599.1 hypothetical protein AYO20_04215 [Fonsecaea nubica]